MMSSRVTSRIVVAVGLAVVFGIGVVSIFVVPAKSGAQSQVAHTAAAPGEQIASNSPAPNAAAPEQPTPAVSANAPAPDAAIPNDTVASADAAVPATNTASEPSSEQSTEPSASGGEMDGRIAEQVRSSIANVAPGSSIDVKAASGIVALAGSVPSQNVVEQARQAAQDIAGVKEVDTSALTVMNQ